MPLKHACFLSYRGLSGDSYYKAIVEGIYQRLNDELKMLIELDKPVCYDWQRFQPGVAVSKSQGLKALCDSLCMVVLYIPRYFKSTQCASEFKAMERLESARLAKLTTPDQSQHRLIVPVILRGASNLPEIIQQNSCSIFMDDLSASSLEDAKLIKLAQYIADCYELFESVDLAEELTNFPLPSQEEMKNLFNATRGKKPMFPGYKY